MDTVTAHAFIGDPATWTFTLQVDDVDEDVSGASRMVLMVEGGYTLDSATIPSAFDWVSAGDVGKVSIQLGALENVEPGFYQAWLKVHYGDYPSGVMWSGTRLHLRLDEAVL